MKLLTDFELYIASLYAKAPRLASGITKWLGRNIWWLILIGVVSNAVALSVVLVSLLGVPGFRGEGTLLLNTLPIATIVVTLAFLTIETMLMAAAVPLLRAKVKRGWNLLFYAALLDIIQSLYGYVTEFNLLSFGIYVITVALVGYLLFEIRGEFNVKKHDVNPMVGKKVK